MGEEDQDWALSSNQEGSIIRRSLWGRQSCKRIGVPVDHTPSYKGICHLAWILNMAI